jgi:electron transfer flavoprotein alpha subunit
VTDYRSHSDAGLVPPIQVDYPSLWRPHCRRQECVSPASRCSGCLDGELHRSRAEVQIADIIALEPSGDTFTRPIYAGNAILKVKSSPKDTIKIVTVRTTAFDKAAIGGGSATVEEAEAVTADCEWSLCTQS